MKTFFILGRNPELSKHEVLEFLKARKRQFTEVLFEENLLVIETPDDERFNIQEFGGVMWLGKILQEGKKEDIQKYLNQNELIPADKFSYAVFGNLDEEILKEKFKEERKKAIMKHGRTRIKFQNGAKQELPKAEFYLFFHKHKEIAYLGLTNQEYNDKNVKNRDMNKPVRRESLAISPRLSKILINLSGAKPGDLLLDPFCGIGGILQEALVKNIRVYGIDKDKEATIGAEKNIEWLKSQYKIEKTSKIENIDSRKAPDLQFAAIATETPLGKVLKKRPTDTEAKQIIQNFEAYMVPILTRLKRVKKPEARIAMTLPVVKNLHVNANKIAEKCELRVYIKPILESREDQFISRDIVVFQ